MALPEELMRTLIVLGLVTAAASSHAVLIYDNFNASGGVHTFGFTSGGNDNFIADELNTIMPATGSTWQIDDIHIFPIFSVARSYSDVSVRVRVYRTHTQSGTPEVFSDLASDVTWSLGNVSITAAGTYYNVTLPYQPNWSRFNIGTGQNIGIRLDYTEGGVSSTDVSNLITNDNLPPAVGSSPDGWYGGQNPLVTNADRQTFNPATMDNLALQINASAVPEPATLTALGLGAFAILRRRTKR